jgi:hypothetical protein
MVYSDVQRHRRNLALELTNTSLPLILLFESLHLVLSLVLHFDEYFPEFDEYILQTALLSQLIKPGHEPLRLGFLTPWCVLL